MTEMFFAIAVFAVAAVGIGAGLVLGRGPAQASCGASDRLERDRCADCPLRRRQPE